MTTDEVARIRRMCPEDLPRVIEIAAALQEAPQWPEAAYAAALEPGAVRRIALVALRPEGVAGFAVASVVSAQAELESIAVDTASQRRGSGTLLLQALTAELLAAGAEDIFLEVRASNRRALALYRRTGFAETGRRPRYYTDPVEDAVQMKLCVQRPSG